MVHNIQKTEKLAAEIRSDTSSTIAGSKEKMESVV